MKKIESQKGKMWLKRELCPYRNTILFLAFLTIVTTLFGLAFAYLVRYLINSASAGDKGRLLTFAGIVLGVLLCKIFLQTLNGFLSERARGKIVASLRAKLFSKILRSDYATVQAYHSGELLNRLTTDVNEVAVDSVGLLQTVAGMVVQCVGAIVALLTIDPLFTGIYVVCGLVVGGISATFRRKIKKHQTAFLTADGESKAFIQEGLSSVLTLKAYGAEGKCTEKAEDFSLNYFKKRMARNRLRSSMNGLFSLLSNTGTIFAVLWCSVSVLRGNQDYGSILSVILLLMQLQHPFAAFSGVVPVYYSRLTSGERLAELDKMETEQTETINAADLYGRLQEICLKNVTFNYGRESVLQGANGSLKKGDIVCVTGQSGSGKSTLFRLLLNVYKLNAGEILMRIKDSEGERSLPLGVRHRDLFAYVPQGNFLFSGTIYENLTFFSTETDTNVLKEKIDVALKVACAEFVNELPEGLETPLLERGGGLSEGQLQRLAVARAVLSDRPILLLDEATSALDGETEKNLLQNIRKMKNKTCVIVTHRPAALEIADSVLKVENGKIC